MKELIGSLSILFGTTWLIFAMIGMIRFPDYNTKLHALSKATTFGMLFLFVGCISHFATLSVVIKIILVVGFIFVTAPVASHVFAKTLNKQ